MCKVSPSNGYCFAIKIFPAAYNLVDVNTMKNLPVKFTLKGLEGEFLLHMDNGFRYCTLPCVLIGVLVLILVSLFIKVVCELSIKWEDHWLAGV